MNDLTINAAAMQKAFLSGANRINEQKDYINELNVFPVPDGDTGTNMSLTIIAAANEVKKVEDPTVEKLCKAISSGSLRGARGNSGVILSQLFRGFTRAVSKQKELSAQNISDGLNKGVETAYKAVMKPKEGTILTVAKGVADKSVELLLEDMDILEYCEAIVAYGYEVLAKTPDMLPVLKEAGVVDSGGQGLMEVLQGIVDSLTGKVTESFTIESAVKPQTISAKDLEEGSAADIKFGYCTEFIIMLREEMSEETEDEFKEFLLSIGDSLVVVADEEICKVHVHTNHPGQAFEKALTYGALSNMKIDNMRLEHQEKLIKDAEKVAAQQRAEDAARAAAKQKKEPPKKYGFIAVSVGDGLSEIFKGLGVDYLIEGGQTMNPSTEDMLNAIDQVNAEHIFILPNNKNIILAAEQARDLTEDKDIVVLSTKTIPQGIAAMIGFMQESDVEENQSSMTDSFQYISSGQVTYAVRDTAINGKEIHNGDIMGIDDNGIQAVGKDLDDTTLKLINIMTEEKEDAELISLYYGAEVTEEEAEAFAERVESQFPDIEVEVNSGGQPIYYYMISVE